ncbi:MAG: trigger factor [Bacteroidaceae bacterium]
MNISLENVDKVSAKLTVKIEKADYANSVEKQLKNKRKTLEIPGFRVGKVPTGMVKKMYYITILTDEINKILSEKMYEYIRDNDISVLGEPLPCETADEIDFKTQEDFELHFDLAISPKLDFSIDKRNVVPYYSIEITDDMIEKQIASYTQRNGEYEKVDNYEDRDMLKGLIAQLDAEGNPMENGVQVEEAVLMPSYMKNDDQKALFNDCKVNDVITFNPYTAYNGAEAEIASFLKIDKSDVSLYTGDFTYQISEITRFKSGDLNQALFDQVYGEGVVKTEEEFRAKTKETLAEQFVPDQDYRFLLDVRELIESKIGDVQYPDALMKRLLAKNSSDKTPEQIDELYANSLKELTWHIVKEDLTKKYEIKVEENDIRDIARQATRAQLAQYGMMGLADEMIDQYASQMLKDKGQVDNLVNRAVETKLSIALKDQVKLEEKSISMDDFNKLFETEDKAEEEK